MTLKQLFRQAGWRLGDHVLFTGWTVNNRGHVSGLRFSQPGNKELRVGALSIERERDGSKRLKMRVSKR